MERNSYGTLNFENDICISNHLIFAALEEAITSFLEGTFSIDKYNPTIVGKFSLPIQIDTTKVIVVNGHFFVKKADNLESNKIYAAVLDNAYLDIDSVICNLVDTIFPLTLGKIRFRPQQDGFYTVIWLGIE